MSDLKESKNQNAVERESEVLAQMKFLDGKIENIENTVSQLETRLYNILRSKEKDDAIEEETERVPLAADLNGFSRKILRINHNLHSIFERLEN